MINIFYFNCPCCGHKMNAIMVMRLLNGCKSIKDHQCFYCKFCDNKIGKAHGTKLSFYLQIGFFIGIYYLVKYLGLYFDLTLYAYPFLYVIFYCMFLILFVNIYPFSCYEREEEIEREEVDEFYSPVENQRMDGFEKNLIKTTVAIPIVWMSIAFVVLIGIVISSFFD